MANIRKAGIDQIPVIAQLANQIWPIAYATVISQEQISYMLDLFYSQSALEKQITDGHHFIIIYDNDIPVGFSSYSQKNNTDHTIYRLHKLYVVITLHKKGYGKQLIQYIIDDIKLKGATHLELNVNRNNPARFFYSKLGFVITRTEDLDIGSNYFMNDYIMTLSL